MAAGPRGRRLWIAERSEPPRRWQESREVLAAGRTVTLTDGGKFVGRVEPPPPGPRVFGFAKGSFGELRPDSDDPLPDEFWLGGDR